MPIKTLSTTAEELIPRNRLRKSMVFQNEDSTINIFIKQERTAVATVSSTIHDHRLGPGGAIALNFGTDGKEAIEDRWTVVAASGTPIISFFETEEHVR
ncbi:MAG: hypothetical protein AAB706_00685 [Patescibacteria group bacterium]